MRKFAAVVAVVLGVGLLPRVSEAAPITAPSCAPGALFNECDIYADYDDGLSELGAADGNLGGYLVGYTLLLKTSADLSDGLAASEVAHILVVHDNLFELFSNIATLLFNFDQVFAQASTNADIDSTPVAQILGCPDVNGVLNVNGVGYCTTADEVTLFPDYGFGVDLLRIHTAFQANEEPPTNPVPEPGTLTLLGFGGSAAAAAIRRRRAAKAAN